MKLSVLLLLLLLVILISGCISFLGQKSWDRPQQQPQPQPKPQPQLPPQVQTPTQVPTPKMTVPQSSQSILLKTKYNISFSSFNDTTKNLIVEVPSKLIQTNLTFECKSFIKNVSSSFDTKKVKVFEFQNITCKSRDGIVKFNNTQINFIIPNNSTKTMVIEE